MRPYLALLIIAPFLVQCAGKRVADTNYENGYQHLAWLDGDVQSDYTPDRKIAEAKVEDWNGKEPSSEDTNAYLEYLSALDASGRATEAETKIKAFLFIHPNEKRAVFLLGVHYARQRKQELAAYFFHQLEKDASFPDKSLVYNNLGMLSLQKRDRAGAVAWFEKASSASPAAAVPYVNLGAMYLQSRSYADAYSLFSKAHALDQDFEDAALGMGVTLEGQGKFAEAHQVYTDFLSNHPNALSVLYNDSILLGNRLKRRQEASEQLLRYIQRGGRETAKAHEMIQGWR